MVSIRASAVDDHCGKEGRAMKACDNRGSGLVFCFSIPLGLGTLHVSRLQKNHAQSTVFFVKKYRDQLI